MSALRHCQVSVLTHKYWVHWGYRYEEALNFETFSAALECYRAHRNDRFGAAIVTGEGYDPPEAEGSRKFLGLTDDEIYQIEASQ